MVKDMIYDRWQMRYAEMQTLYFEADKITKEELYDKYNSFERLHYSWKTQLFREGVYKGKDIEGRFLRLFDNSERMLHRFQDKWIKR